MKKISLFMLFLLLTFVLAAETITGKVSWIYDGDSFLMQMEGGQVQVRIWGIDAPECKQPGGREAAKFLIGLIKDKNVSVEKVELDSYGRIVGKVYCESLYVNLEILKNGHAWWYRHYAPQENEFRRAEENAKARKIGLWSNPNPVNPREWREQNPRQDKP
ncbi:MAG: thermonuclease family protein [Victivallaceae bacterium]